MTSSGSSTTIPSSNTLWLEYHRTVTLEFSKRADHALIGTLFNDCPFSNCSSGLKVFRTSLQLEAALRKKEADLREQEARLQREKNESLERLRQGLRSEASYAADPSPSGSDDVWRKKEELMARKQRQTDEAIKRRQDEEERAARQRVDAANQ
eukprot:8106716-Pyramimonas_sp.AAC.1